MRRSDLLRQRPRRLRSALAVLAGLGAFAAASAAVDSRASLPYSNAAGGLVQRPLPRDSCRARGSGLFELPDPRCTPGALNPQVTPATISRTICASGWTSTVRPSEGVTYPEKRASMASYGVRGPTSAYEYDHLVPLELGGAVNDVRNLWPEPDYPVRGGFYLNPKDRLEGVLRRRVCSGEMPLREAQLTIARDWAAAYRTYG